MFVQGVFMRSAICFGVFVSSCVTVILMQSVVEEEANLFCKPSRSATSPDAKQLLFAHVRDKLSAGQDKNRNVTSWMVVWSNKQTERFIVRQCRAVQIGEYMFLQIPDIMKFYQWFYFHPFHVWSMLLFYNCFLLSVAYFQKFSLNDLFQVLSRSLSYSSVRI